MERVVLREKLVDKNGWLHYVYLSSEYALHTYIILHMLEEWDRPKSTKNNPSQHQV